MDTTDGIALAQDLRPYFESRQDTVMAFVFGSQVKGTATGDSDVDIAVYFGAPKERDGRPLQIDIETDRARLERVVDFLDDEIEDAGQFTELSKQQYRTDRTQRRNVERWIENIVNATIDIAKIILASERARLPQTYRGTIEKLCDVEGFDPEAVGALAGFARLRDILAHEYLDMQFSRFRAFVDAGPQTYGSFRKQIDAWMQGRKRDDED